MEIREFRRGNAAVLRPLVERWRKEANTDMGLHLMVDFVLAELQAMIDAPDSDVLLLILDDVIGGFMGIQTIRSSTGPELLAAEHFWYVAPEKRGRGALRMIDAAKQWAKDRNLGHMLFNASFLASDKADDVARLFERKGMTKFEVSYLAEIDE